MADSPKTPAKRSRSRAKPPASDKEKLEKVAESTEAAPETPPDDEAHPGCVVLKVPVPDNPGTSRVQVFPINGLDELAVTDLLTIGIKVNKERLGID